MKRCQATGAVYTLAEVFYYVNYSVKNSTVDCKYLPYFI